MGTIRCHKDIYQLKPSSSSVPFVGINEVDRDKLTVIPQTQSPGGAAVVSCPVIWEVRNAVRLTAGESPWEASIRGMPERISESRS